MPKKTPTSISLGPVNFELLERDGHFLGLGEIRVGKDLLRSNERPMFAHIVNPNGVELVNFRLEDLKQSADKVVLRVSAERREGGIMEWMVHEVRNRYNTANWARGPRPAQGTTLELELRPIQRTLNGREFLGFSYQYRYSSQDIPVYKILDRATWEAGGDILGSEFWMRNCFVAPIARFKSADQFFSTEWYIPDCMNPSAFQFVPLQTELQGFTYTTSERGTLVTWATEVEHIRSLFEKARGEKTLAHFHEHCRDLANDFLTSPMEVLWAPGTRNDVERANDFEAVFELVSSTLHEKAGLQRERVPTYGQMEEWTPADIEHYRKAGLPKLLKAGVRRIYLANHFENNMNVYGLFNFCCNVDFKIAESVGADKLKALCDDARAGGAIIEMWNNTALSNVVVLLDGCDPKSNRIKPLPRQDSIMEAINRDTGFVRNPSNAVEADHYTPLFAVLNLRDKAVHDYFLRRWQEAHDHVGIQGVFLDSSFNMSSDKFHYVQNSQSHVGGATADNVGLLGNYRPAKEPPAAILTQYHAHLEIVAAMQKMGVSYCNEDLGVFGIHRHGPHITTRLDNLFMWPDCIVGFDARAIKQAGRDPDDIFIRGLSYRQMWNVYWHVPTDDITYNYSGARDDSDRPTPWHLDLLRAYTEVEPDMIERTILPNEIGVLYRSGKKWVVWAFGDLALPVRGEGRDVLTGQAIADSASPRKVGRGVYAGSES